jgi:hypothetical protein
MANGHEHVQFGKVQQHYLSHFFCCLPMAATAAFSNAFIVDAVVSFVGGYGRYLYLGPISKAFYQAFSALKGADRPRLTLLPAIFESAAHVREACEHGFCLRGRHSYFSMWAQIYAGHSPECETLRVAHEFGMPYTVYVTRAAAESGSLAKLQFLHQQTSCEWPNDIAECAARSGSLSLVQWLLQLPKSDKETEFTAATSEAAVKAGHLHIAQLLHSAGVRLRGHLCAIAAERADLPMLQVSGANSSTVVPCIAHSDCTAACCLRKLAEAQIT